MEENNQTTIPSAPTTKFCKHCGERININAVMCIKCGMQVEELKSDTAQPSIIINNENTNTNINGAMASRQKNKWVSLCLCFFLGYLGAHKFYEGKAGLGVLYLFTIGLFGIGIFVDLITLLFKPNPYFV